MLHSCHNALFYFLLFNSSLNPLEFKFELDCLNLLLKKKKKPLPHPISFQPNPLSFSFSLSLSLSLPAGPRPTPWPISSRVAQLRGPPPSPARRRSITRSAADRWGPPVRVIFLLPPAPCLCFWPRAALRRCPWASVRAGRPEAPSDSAPCAHRPGHSSPRARNRTGR